MFNTPSAFDTLGSNDNYAVNLSSEPVPNRVFLRTWCHQCKMRKGKVTACDNFFSTDKEVRCNGRYCDACIQRHYQEDPTQFQFMKEWMCYRCTGRCTCAACKRRRKVDEDIEYAPETRKREPKRRDDDDFINTSFPVMTKRRTLSPPPLKMTTTGPSVNKVIVKKPKKEKKNGKAMNALALLADESLTTDFGASANPEEFSPEIKTVHEHTAEIAKLKEMCASLQAQVTELSNTIKLQKTGENSFPLDVKE